MYMISSMLASYPGSDAPRLLKYFINKSVSYLGIFTQRISLYIATEINNNDYVLLKVILQKWC